MAVSSGISVASPFLNSGLKGHGRTRNSSKFGKRDSKRY